MSLDNWNPETDPQPSGKAGETEPRLPVAEAMEELLAELLSSEEAGGGPACGAPGPGGQPAEPDGADDWLEPAEDDSGPAGVAPGAPVLWLPDGLSTLATGPAVDKPEAGAGAGPEDWPAAGVEPVAEAGGVEAAAAAHEIGRPGDGLEAAAPETSEPEAVPVPGATVEVGRPEDVLVAPAPGTGKPEAPAGSMDPAIKAAGLEEPVVSLGSPGDRVETAGGWPTAVEPVVEAGGVEAAAALELASPAEWLEAVEPETDEPEAVPSAGVEPVAAVEPGRSGDRLETAEGWYAAVEPVVEAGGVEAAAALEPASPAEWLDAVEPETDEPEAVPSAGVEPVAAVEPGRSGDRLETAEGWPTAVEPVVEAGGVEAAAALEPASPAEWLETVEPETDEPEAVPSVGVEPVAAVEPGRSGDRLETADSWPAAVEPMIETGGVEAAAALEPASPEEWLEAVEPETDEPGVVLAAGTEPVVEAGGVEAVEALDPGRPEDWLEAVAQVAGGPETVPGADVEQDSEAAGTEAGAATLEPGRPGDWLEASEPEPEPEAAAREENAAAWPGGWLGLIEPTAAPGLALEASAMEDAPASSGQGGARSWLVEESPAGESLEPPDASEWLEPLLGQAGAREVPADLAPSAPEPLLTASAEEWLQPPGGDEWLESLLERSADAEAGGEPGAPAEMAADDPWSSESGDALWEMPEEAAAAPEAAALGPGAWEPPGQADLPSETALFVPEGEEAGAPDTPDAGEGAGAEEYPQAAPAAPIAEPLVEPVSVAPPPVPAGPSLEEVIAGIDRTIEDAGRAAPDAAGERQSPARPERIKPGLEDYLVFSLSGTDYALPIHEVTEIGRVPALTRVPNVPHFVRGITNLRGEVIAVLSLPVLLGYGEPPPSPRGRVLFVHLREQSLTTGLMVEDVKGIQRIPAQQLEPVPSFLEDKVTGVLRGVHGRGDRLLNVLHLGHLFELPEIRQLSAQ